MVLGPIGRHVGSIGRRGWHLREDERERQRREMSDLVRAGRVESGEPAPSDDPPDRPRPSERAQWDEKRQAWIEWDPDAEAWVEVG